MQEFSLDSFFLTIVICLNNLFEVICLLFFSSLHPYWIFIHDLWNNILFLFSLCLMICSLFWSAIFLLIDWVRFTSLHLFWKNQVSDFERHWCFFLFCESKWVMESNQEMGEIVWDFIILRGYDLMKIIYLSWFSQLYLAFRS